MGHEKLYTLGPPLYLVIWGLYSVSSYNSNKKTACEKIRHFFTVTKSVPDHEKVKSPWIKPKVSSYSYTVLFSLFEKWRKGIIVIVSVCLHLVDGGLQIGHGLEGGEEEEEGEGD